ncbi:ARM repeat-containing protein [Violaceomyces palustris]|uniref:ARM repeat-containing protein n=1 Tax=Violaceomyces palustris TaxID=1673888 RepID=A0ACD0NVT3_9BASI|nr:ARM repeat-containing protein [Violaceomyces palustris]
MSSQPESVAAKQPQAPYEAPPLVQLTNKWINDLTARTRARPIPWEGYHRANLLSSDELKMINAVISKQDKSKTESLLEEQGGDYASLFLRLLSKLSRTDTLQQILVLVGDMLNQRDDRLELFLQSQGQEEHDGIYFPWGPFVKLLEVQDDFVQLRSAHFLTLLLVYSASKSSRPSPPPNVLPRLLEFLVSLLEPAHSDRSQVSGQTSSTSGSIPRRATSDFAEGNGPDISLVLLEALLRSQKYRQIVWAEEIGRLEGDSKKVSEERSNGLIPNLVQILRQSLLPSGSALPSLSVSPSGSKPGSGSATPSTQTTAATSSTLVPLSVQGSSTRASTQITYQATLVLWLLSFDKEIAEGINSKFGVATILTDVARNAVKEKVIRVIVAIFRNLLEKAPEANASALLGAKALTLCQNLSTRKWSDEEIEEDIQLVKEKLAHKLEGMTSYDEYLSELSSGQLTFENPAHELEDFWKENAAKLVENDGETLKKLVAILKESQDSVSLAVACSDIGKFVQFFEPGKRRVDQLGAKVRIMDLMSHSDPDVKFRALHTVSRLVSASWR